MNKPLYLLRQPVGRIPEALFALAETDGEVVLLEEAVSEPPVHPGSLYVVGLQKVPGMQTLTYEDLVEKIFSADRVMVF